MSDVFIAYDHNSVPVSVVCAKSKELANAFWQGKGLYPHTVKSLSQDFTPLADHPTGVFPLVSTKMVHDRAYDQKYVTVLKNA